MYLTCAAWHGMTYSHCRSRVPPYTRFTRAFKTDYCKHPVRLTYANSVATNSLNERARWIFGCFKPTDRANVKPANFVVAFLLIVCSSRRQNCERKEKTEKEREREGGETLRFRRAAGKSCEKRNFVRSHIRLFRNSRPLILITNFLINL